MQIFEENLDQGDLKSLIQEAILETGMNQRRVPTKDEVLDFLFSGKRHDPEAIYLAKRITPMILRCLDKKKRA